MTRTLPFLAGTCDTKLLTCRSTCMCPSNWKFLYWFVKILAASSCFCSLADHKQLSVKDFECSICVKYVYEWYSTTLVMIFFELFSLLWLPMTTPCGHVFCRECLIRSIDNTQAQCPMCKNSLDEVLSIKKFANFYLCLFSFFHCWFNPTRTRQKSFHK